MIKLNINGYDQLVTFSTFPGGEEHVNMATGTLPQCPDWDVTVTARITSSSELIRVLLLADAILAYGRNITGWALDLGYLPYARQDRICTRGESFSLRILCNLINSLNFDRVLIDDAHSDVGPALLNGVINRSQADCMTTSRETHNLLITADYIVAPDLGAAKKAEAVAARYNLPVIQCMKTRVCRDILKVSVINAPHDLTESNLVVVDDICDGGGTFLALAAVEEFQGVCELNLVVTHGIFSKGKKILLNKYNNVEAVHDWTK